MRFIKKNILLSFGIMFLILSVVCGGFGYYAAGHLETKQTQLSNLTWSMEPTADYDYIKATDSPNHYIGYYTQADEKHLLDSTGQIIEVLSDQRDLGRGYYEFYNEDYYCGVVDENGKILIEAEHGSIELKGDYFIVLGATDRISFWNLEGKCIYQEPQKSFASHLGNNVYLVKQDYLEKAYIFYADTLKTKPLSIYISNIISDGNGGLLGEHGGRYYPLDEDYNLIENGTIYGHYGELSEGLRYVTFYDEQSEKTTPCYVDENGDVIIELKGQVPESAGPFREGKALLQRGKQLVCIDKTGTELFALESHHESSTVSFNEEFYYSEGLAAVALEWNKYGYIDETGEFVIQPVFYEAGEINDGLAIVAFKNDSREYGILKVH